MTRDLDQLADQLFDLVVVGGGITGAFAAWDAALRGLRVVLVDRADFGAATSSASSKVIHGGIRHLQKGEIGRVRESLRERAVFLRIAPHLVHHLPFLIPTYGHVMQGREVLTAAMAAYELIGLDQNRGLRDPEKRVPRFEVLGRREALALEPDLPAAGLTGGVRYTECHMHSSERTTLAVVMAAAEAGAVVANHVEVVGFRREGARVAGVQARNALGDGAAFDVHARLVANMTGPWAPRLLAALDRRPAGRFALSKGVHLVTRSLTRNVALALATGHQHEGIVSRGGRHLFIIPWRGRSLIGTTNVPFDGDPADVGVTEKDVADFVAEIDSGFPAARLRREEVEFAFAGLYPLVDKEVRAGVYQGASAYHVVDHAPDGVEGLITVIGAKYTTARNLARQAIDLAFRKLGTVRPPRARTAETPVHGGRIERFSDFLGEAIGKDRAAHRLGEEIVRELVMCYGTEYPAVLQHADKDPGAGARVAASRPTIRAMVRHAVLHEMALRLDDVVFRRTGLGTIGDPGEDGLRAAAAIMAEELGWDAARVERELERVRTRFRTRG